MHINSVLFAQVIKTVKISGPSGGSLYGINLSRAFEQRYGFLQAPRTVSEFDPAKGITYLHGYFENRIVIDRFQVYNNGLLVEMKSDTDDCERFLEDVMEWAEKEAGVTFDRTESKMFYTSQIEAKLEISLSDALDKLADYGRQLADVLRSYGHNVPDLTPSSIVFSSEAATTFKIERREGTPEGARIYFCGSPFRTKDQIRMLEIAEKLIAG